MSHSNRTFRRLLAVLLSLAMLTSSLPPRSAFAHAQETSSADEGFALIDFLVEGLFDQARTDRHGNRLARFEEGTNSFSFYHAPAGGTFRRRLHVFVDETTPQLQVNLVVGRHPGGRVRLRLISPSGEVFAPSRASRGRHGSLTPLQDLLPDTLLPPPAARSGQVDDNSPSWSLHLGDQPVGTRYLDTTSGEAFLNLQNPEPGDWTVQIVAQDADELLLSTAVWATRADEPLAATDLLYRSSCTIGVKFVLGTVKIVFGALLIAKLPFVAGAVALELAALEMATLLAEVTLDVLVQFGIVSKDVAATLNLFPAALEVVSKINVLGSSIKGVFSALASAFGRKGSETFARAICQALGSFLAFSPRGIQSLARTGEPYRDDVQVINSSGKVTFNLASGSLPPGFRLDSKSGRIQGTHDKEGTWKFTVRAKDSDGKAERKFSIQLVDPDLGNGKGVDLVVDGFALNESSVQAGDRITATFTVRNVGGLTAAAGQYSLQWGTTRKLGVQIGSMGGYPALSGDGTFSARRRFQVPEGFGRSGTMFVGLVVDATNTTVEKKARGGTGEKNNVSTTSLAVSDRPPYAVLNPAKRASLTPGETVVISWEADGTGGDLANVDIALLQNGKRKATIQTNTGGPYRWKVPTRYTGNGFTIEVTSTSDEANWARSGAFSIVDGQNLSGTWRLRRKITVKIDGTPTQTDIDSFDAEVEHDTKRNTAEVSFDGERIGTFTLKKGKLTATAFFGESFDGSGNVFRGDLFKAPNLSKVLTNKGSFTSQRFSFTLKMVFTLTASQNLTLTFEFTGTRK